MSNDERQEFDRLHQELQSTRKHAEDARCYYRLALGKSSGDLRLYQTLLWSLLASGALYMIARLLER